MADSGADGRSGKMRHRSPQVRQHQIWRRLVMISFRIVVCLSLLWAGFAWAQIYKWTDRQGTVHFTDNPSRIPAEGRSEIEVEHAISPAPPAAPDDSAEAPQDRPAAPGAPPSAAPLRDRLGQGPDDWRTLAQQWSTQRQHAVRERDQLQLLYRYTRQLANATRDVRDRGRLEAESARLAKAIAEVEAQVKEAETMLESTLPLEAMQLGADPDWLKPPTGTR